MRAFYLCLAALFLSGCTPALDPAGVRPRPESVTGIAVTISGKEGEIPTSPARWKEIATAVNKHLAGWGYPMEGQKGASEPTHVLAAEIGKVVHKSSPVGLSFSGGNSDPRSLEFQKADALPVDCVLYPVRRPADKAKLYMDFIANDDLAGLASGNVGGKLGEILASHVSTVCFNLLEELKIPKIRVAQPEPAASQWIPEVRIEVREKPAHEEPVPPVKSPAKPATSAAPVSPTKPTPPVEPPATTGESTPPPSEPQTEPEPEADKEAPPVTTESKQSQGRKQMIIHNQGAPVILEFGYERR